MDLTHPSSRFTSYPGRRFALRNANLTWFNN